MLVVSVTIVQSDAPKMRGRRVMADPAWRPRFQKGRRARGAHVRPGLRRAGPAVSAALSSEASRRRARAASVRASYSAMTDWFGTPKARLMWSTLVETRGRHMMRLATKAGSATPSAVRRPSPPQVTPVVACHQEWSCKSSLSEAFTEARDCPSNATIKRDQQIFNEKVSVDAHVVHELGHVRALPGEDHLRWA